MTLGEARDLNVRDVAHEIEDLFYRQPFRVPAQFAFAGRAIGTLVRVSRPAWRPSSTWSPSPIPYAQTFLGLTREGAGQTAQQVFRQVLDAGRVSLTSAGTHRARARQARSGRAGGSVWRGRAQRDGAARAPARRLPAVHLAG